MADQRVGTPTEEDLLKLSRWARVAFAARCARRVQPIVNAWKAATVAQAHCDVIDRAIALAESSARQGKAEVGLREACDAARAVARAVGDAGIKSAAYSAAYAAAYADVAIHDNSDENVQYDPYEERAREEAEYEQYADDQSDDYRDALPEYSAVRDSNADDEEYEVHDGYEDEESYQDDGSYEDYGGYEEEPWPDWGDENHIDEIDSAFNSLYHPNGVLTDCGPYLDEDREADDDDELYSSASEADAASDPEFAGSVEDADEAARAADAEYFRAYDPNAEPTADDAYEAARADDAALDAFRATREAVNNVVLGAFCAARDAARAHEAAANRAAKAAKLASAEACEAARTLGHASVAYASAAGAFATAHHGAWPADFWTDYERLLRVSITLSRDDDTPVDVNRLAPL